MKYRIKLIGLIVAITTLLTGCSDKETEQSKPQYFDLNKVQEFSKTDFKEVDITETRLNVERYDITLPKGTYCGGYSVYGNNIYYSIIYPDPRHTGGEFEKEYNTSIWNYRIDTKDRECIYQYDLDYCIEIPRMKCNQDVLVWSDYFPVNGLNLRYAYTHNIGESTKIKVGKEDGYFHDVNPTLTEDHMYWYEKEPDEMGKFILNKYNFKEGITYKERENVSLVSPYQQLYICESIYAVCEQNVEDRYNIIIYDMKKEKEEIIEISEIPKNIICNSRYCIWTLDGSVVKSNCIYVYSPKYKQMMKMKVGRIFSYALIDNIVIVNGELGVIAYNLDTKEKTEIFPEELLYTNVGNDNNVYLKFKNIDESMLSIMNITTSG